MIELKPIEVPPTGVENNRYREKLWEKDYNMQKIKNVLRWYRNNDVFTTLEVNQELLAFLHKMSIVMLQLEFNLPKQNKKHCEHGQVIVFASLRIGNFYIAGTQKNIDCFSANRFYAYCNTLFEVIGCYHKFLSCLKA